MTEMVFPGDTASPMLPPSDRSYHSSYRDFNLYGTYPRKQAQHFQRRYFNPQQHGSLGPPLTSNGLCSGQQHQNPYDIYNGRHSLKGILRNRSEYAPVCAEDLDTTQETYGSQSDLALGSPEIKERKTRFISCLKCGDFMDEYVRPTVAELLSVLLASFFSTFVQFTLITMTVHRVIEVTIMAVLEGAICSMLFDAFAQIRVHLNPAITLATLFAGTYPVILCMIYLIMQMVGTVLGVFLYQVVALQSHLSVPVVSTVANPESTWLAVVYQLVLCQGLSFTPIVLCHLMSAPPVQTTIEKEKTKQIGSAYSMRGIGCAIGVCSFISLLVSNVSWNPMRTLAICLVATFQNLEVRSWRYQYVFWIGPLIGSLLASFLYRILFANDDRRLQCCGKRQKDSLV